MNTLKSLILIAQTITTFANAYDVSDCMANKKQENAATKWECGKKGKVEYYCIGNNVCDKKSNKCVVTKEGVHNADPKYSSSSYKAIEAKCLASAKKRYDDDIRARKKRGEEIDRGELRGDDEIHSRAEMHAYCRKTDRNSEDFMTEDNDAHRFRCGKIGGTIYYCLANNSCSTAGWCGQTAKHRLKAQKKYSPSAYKEKVHDCIMDTEEIMF